MKIELLQLPDTLQKLLFEIAFKLPDDSLIEDD